MAEPKIPAGRLVDLAHVAEAARRRFDLAAVTAVNRLGRGLPDFLGVLGELHSAGTDLYVRREGLDTTSPTARAAALGLMGLFAELERNLIRVLAGLARARAQGRRLGRPRMSEAKRQAIRASLEARHGSLRQIASLHRVGVGSVQRIAA